MMHGQKNIKKEW